MFSSTPHKQQTKWREDVSITLILSLAIYLSLSTQALACGGLFCDNTQPVNQAAERILFAPDEAEGLMHMHVQITYQGPPDAFSWLLPVPPGTDFGLSRAELFNELDRLYAPMFRLNRIEAEYCPRNDNANLRAFATAESAQEPEIDDGVQVTSQSRVGPYDQVTLQADDVSSLITWLEENDYQVPPNAEETLMPYISAYEFLAIKLSAGQESGDIQPVALKFPGDIATIPLRPTAVAAEPDMGVIVHLLGASRGVPSNYQHVELNLAALDWFNAPRHYAQLVSHAVDEAEDGHAFVTDFAGPHNFSAAEIAPLISPNLVLAMEEVRDSEALYEVLVRLLEGPQQPDLDQILVSALPFTREESERLIILARSEAPLSNVEVSEVIYDADGLSQTVDGAATAQLLSSYNRGGQDIQRLFSVNSYMTRLYTTLNASEMDVDPSFTFNPDLEDVPRERVADLYLDCNGDFNRLVTPEGYELDLSNNQQLDPIERQNGETVRGQQVIGAAVISRTMSAGQAEITSDQREQLSELYKIPVVDAGGFFGCEQDQRSHNALNTLLSLLSLLISLAYLRARKGEDLV